MKTILLEIQYLPSLAYFTAIAHADQVLIEDKEYFEKQSFRNRCRILTSTKVLDLSIPVHHQGKKILIRDLEIDYVQKWQNNHWRSIETAYRKAPFFDYYADPIKEKIYQGYSSLFDLNMDLLTICLEFLGIDVKLEFPKKYDKTPEKDVLDLRSTIHPKKNIEYSAVPYYQIFGKDFVSNLSIIDLLFCEGPRALEVLKSSIVNRMNN